MTVSRDGRSQTCVIAKGNPDMTLLFYIEQLCIHFYLPCPGYAGVYQKRTGSHKDGCAVFYRTADVELLTWSGVKYQKGVQVLNRDNVGIVAKFAISQGEK